MIKINYKKIVVLIIMAIIFTSIGAYVATQIMAHEITYNPTNENFNVTNVEDAINELYDFKESKNEYEVIERKNGLNMTYSYTIGESDMNYSKMLVYVSAVNDAKGTYPAKIVEKSENINTIYDGEEYHFTDNSLNITNYVFIGEIKNYKINDEISIKTYYSGSIILIGVK